jgi:hypothetical protein
MSASRESLRRLDSSDDSGCLLRTANPSLTDMVGLAGRGRGAGRDAGRERACCTPGTLYGVSGSPLHGVRNRSACRVARHSAQQQNWPGAASNILRQRRFSQYLKAIATSVDGPQRRSQEVGKRVIPAAAVASDGKPIPPSGIWLATRSLAAISHPSWWRFRTRAARPGSACRSPSPRDQQPRSYNRRRSAGQPHPQRLGSTNRWGVEVRQCIGCDAVFRKTAEQFFECNPGFKARAIGAHAEVDTTAKAMCFRATRWMSKRSASSKIRGSRFAAAKRSITFSPALMVCPRISTSVVVVRVSVGTGPSNLSTSSIALGSNDMSATISARASG